MKIHTWHRGWGNKTTWLLLFYSLSLAAEYELYWYIGIGLVAIYKRGQGFELGTTEIKSSKWPERDSNPGPPDCESDALTTRPRCLFKSIALLFATIESRRKPERVNCHKDLWDRYWRRANQLLANFFSLSTVTVPQVFAKVNASQSPSHF